MTQTMNLLIDFFGPVVRSVVELGILSKENVNISACDPSDS